MDQKPSYKLEIVVVLGYVFFLVLLVVVAGIWAYDLVSKQPALLSTKKDPFLANLPTQTPAAHFLGNDQLGVRTIFKDQFTDNQNLWNNSQYPANFSVMDGKLTFGSSSPGQIAMVSTAMVESVIVSQDNFPFYLQADLSEDQRAIEGFGFFFAGQPSKSDLFFFEIYPESKRYVLYHFAKGSWSRRMAGTSYWIRSYPAVNTFGIYINKGNLEFYINHQIIDAYQDSWDSFQVGESGFFVNNAGFQLTITNFFIDGFREY